MRYRRIGYRYTMIVKQPITRGGAYQVRAGDVVLSHPHWHPDMDVYETATALTVTVELAGVDVERLRSRQAEWFEGRARKLREELAGKIACAGGACA